MDRDKGNPKNGTFWGFRGGVLFWDPRGTPPPLEGGSRIPDFKDPFSGPPLGVPVWTFPNRPIILNNGPKANPKISYLFIGPIISIYRPHKFDGGFMGHDWAWLLN